MVTKGTLTSECNRVFMLRCCGAKYPYPGTSYWSPFDVIHHLPVFRKVFRVLNSSVENVHVGVVTCIGSDTYSFNNITYLYYDMRLSLGGGGFGVITCILY